MNSEETSPLPRSEARKGQINYSPRAWIPDTDTQWLKPGKLGWMKRGIVSRTRLCISHGMEYVDYMGFNKCGDLGDGIELESVYKTVYHTCGMALAL